MAGGSRVHPDPAVGGRPECSHGRLPRGLAGRDWFRAQLGAILGAPRAGAPRPAGGRYLLDRNDGRQDQDVVTVADDLTALAAGGRVLIDPAEFSPDGSVSLRAAILSPDGQWVAYMMSDSGSDWAQVRVRAVDSGADHADVVSFAKFVLPEWLPDSSGFFYWAYPEHGQATGDDPTALGAGRLLLHRLGDARDEVIYQADGPSLRAAPAVFSDGWLIMTIKHGSERKSLIQARRLRAGELGPVVPVVSELQARFEAGGHGRRRSLSAD